MAKYDQLAKHLKSAYPREVVLSFEDIEGVLGSRLPRSADRPQFWANTVAEARHIQREAWRQAHYNAFLIADARAVRFVPHTR
ncbi:DUF7662 domain-containing protein [Devosia nitrariae]|uniref:DUF7662 domain-containing protein n=1 Tax=Devosia nitrariae TaxID=2071872 RepID=A0ABQ5W520_9HYPH|nr:hypothetical protein [Devosia nitrariae]GLQ54884.1 hypothetical protein GCM10010862_21430 [Devosia nitrariae]